MLIAHLSDFHVFTTAPETPIVRLDAEEAARRVVADVAAFSPAVDLVLVTGDLTDGGTPEDYALFQSIVAPLNVPVLVIPGNHDKRENMRAAFADQLPLEPGTLVNYETTVGDVRIIALDSLIPGRVDGALDDSTLDWLESRLKIVTDGYTLIMVHHPPFPSRIEGLDRMSLTGGADRLAALVRAYPGSLGVLTGHIHRPFQGIWNGAFCAVGGSPAFQIDLDLHVGASEPAIVSEPYSYMVHVLYDEGITTHRRYVEI